MIRTGSLLCWLLLFVDGKTKIEIKSFTKSIFLPPEKVKRIVKMFSIFFIQTQKWNLDRQKALLATIIIIIKSAAAGAAWESLISFQFFILLLLHPKGNEIFQSKFKHFHFERMNWLVHYLQRLWSHNT